VGRYRFSQGAGGEGRQAQKQRVAATSAGSTLPVSLLQPRLYSVSMEAMYAF